MDTDKELLELAAKAAGATKCEYTELHGEDYGFYADFGNGMEKWYPLTDDGDALRLMVKLRMLVDVPSESESHRKWIEIVAPHLRYDIKEPISKDMEASTRRAIVRAAAEIGRAMP